MPRASVIRYIHGYNVVVCDCTARSFMRKPIALGLLLPRMAAILILSIITSTSQTWAAAGMAE